MGLLKDFHLSPDFSFSFWLMLLYALLYFFWGIFLGYKSFKLPQKLFLIASSLPRFEPNPIAQNKTKSKFSLKWLGLLLTLAFIGFTFWLSEGTLNKGLYVLLRTLLVLVVILFVVTPLLRFLLQKISSKVAEENAFGMVSQQMHNYSQMVQSVWEFSNKKRNALFRIWFFMEIMLAISLYPLNEN
jgi:hypothetical protein